MQENSSHHFMSEWNERVADPGESDQLLDCNKTDQRLKYKEGKSYIIHFYFIIRKFTTAMITYQLNYHNNIFIVLL